MGSAKIPSQFNDTDVRINMIKSLELEELPPITLESIDDASGLIAKKTSFFKNYNLEKLLEDLRRR